MHDITLSFILHLFFRSLGAVSLLQLGDSFLSFGRNITLAFGLTLFFAGFVPCAAPPAGQTLIWDFFIGFLIGVPAALFIDGVKSFGELIDSGRGQNIGNLYDPLSNQNVSGLAILAERMCFAMLLCAGLFESVINALRDSFAAIPPGTAVLSSLPSCGLMLLNLISGVVGGLFSAYMIFALLYVLTDFFTGVAVKALGGGAGLNNEAFQLKTILTFFVLLMFLGTETGGFMIEAARPRPEIYLLPGG